MAWLRDNKRKPGIDPQNCRIITNADIMKGLRDYRVIFLPNWQASPAAKDISLEIAFAKASGNIKVEHMR